MTMDKKLVCVTGGNGYIASMLIKQLLQKGYTVKTTVRNPGFQQNNFSLTFVCVMYIFLYSYWLFFGVQMIWREHLI